MELKHEESVEASTPGRELMHLSPSFSASPLAHAVFAQGQTVSQRDGTSASTSLPHPNPPTGLPLCGLFLLLHVAFLPVLVRANCSISRRADNKVSEQVDGGEACIQAEITPKQK